MSLSARCRAKGDAMRIGSRTQTDLLGVRTGQVDIARGFVDDLRRQRSREWLVAHGIDTMMVSVPKIARALGYAPATLYGYIKGGTFFLPHRLVNGSPMVALDDLLDWVCDKAQDVRPESNAPVVAEEPEERCSRHGAKRRVEDETAGESSDIDRARRKMLERAVAKVNRLSAAS
jgi:hypothetical protein